MMSTARSKDRLYSDTRCTREWLLEAQGLRPLHSGSHVVRGDLVTTADDRVRGPVGRFVSCRTDAGLVEVDWSRSREL